MTASNELVKMINEEFNLNLLTVDSAAMNEMIDKKFTVVRKPNVELGAKFSARDEDRIPVEVGKNVVENGKRLGEGGHNKDCFWSGYELDGKFYITLNDNPGSVWEADENVTRYYCSE